jgi:hypothetical protein
LALKPPSQRLSGLASAIVGGYALSGAAMGVQNGGVVATTELTADCRQRVAGQLTSHVHG